MPPKRCSADRATSAAPSAVDRSAATYTGHAFNRLPRCRARGGHHLHTGSVQALNDRGADAFGSPGDQRPQALQLKIEAHAVISSAAISPRSRRK